ncbi:hypothetical protein [Sphingomonas sp. LM7]|uniref:hypothetical protein n=1 Tax=Sphingomonas sp. LM7 TaxID=1938607 RepID=UPI000983E2D3|nr:hypothetical protein [Sphingomonas sp. LM7]AQR72376.1 hypothetical protein BXU08_00665 [Sphingomonas sp. LM7]
MLKKLVVVMAASTMVLGSTAAMADSASATRVAETRAATAATGESQLLPGSPLFAILGLIGVAALLEVTGVINVFGGDDEPESP